MRVAIVPIEFPVISETFVINIAAGLIERGHDVNILPLYRKYPVDHKKVHPLVNKYKLLERTIYPPSVRIFNKIYHFPLALRGLFSTGLKPYDIVHFQFGEAALKFLPLRHARVFDGKWVVSFRGFDISSYILKHGERVYDDVFKQCDLFLSNSEFFRQRLMNLGSEERKTFVYRSGIDCQKFIFEARKLTPGKRIKIVTVSRLTEKKGVEYSIRAVAHLIKGGFPIDYAIIGNGPLKNDLEQLIAQLQMVEHIKLLGPKDQKGVIEELNNSHIFVTTCVTAENGDQNGPDNTIKEAMAVGLPVVASRSAAIPEVIEDGKTGFLFHERDVLGIAEKIQYLIEHPEIWPELTNTARKFVEEVYNLDKLSDQLVEQYQKILTES